MTEEDDRPRRSNGSFTSEYKPADFLKAVEDLDDPTTSNIADSVECGVGTAHRYLEQLHNDGRVDRQEKYGAVIWKTR